MNTIRDQAERNYANQYDAGQQTAIKGQVTIQLEQQGRCIEELNNALDLLENKLVSVIYDEDIVAPDKVAVAPEEYLAPLATEIREHNKEIKGQISRVNRLCRMLEL